jgi:hypothetical protein
VDTGELFSYALAAIGLLTIGWAAWSAKSTGIDREVGNTILLKLLKAANHERARKLCRAAPGSYFDAVGAAIDAAVATGSRDIAALDAVAQPAFDAKGVAVIDRWRGIMQRGFVGVLLVLGGAALPLSEGALPVPHAVTGGIAVLAAVWFGLKRSEADTSIEIARREIVPAVSKAIVDVPPAPAPGPAKADDTGPFRSLTRPRPRPKHTLPSLRDNQCPLCGPTTTRTVAREGGKFSVLVCTGCGYTQEFADLTKLDAS